MSAILNNKTLLLKLLGLFGLLHALVWGLPELPSLLWAHGVTMLHALQQDPRAFAALLTGLALTVAGFHLRPPKSLAVQIAFRLSMLVLSLFCYAVCLTAMETHVAQMRLPQYALTLYTGISLLGYHYIDTLKEFVDSLDDSTDADLAGVGGLLISWVVAVGFTLSTLDLVPAIVIIGAMVCAWATGITLAIKLSLTEKESNDAETDTAQA